MVTCGAIANRRHLANDIKRDAKRILSNQGANKTYLILPHSIGNNYLVDMGTSFSENKVTNSTGEYPRKSNDEITRSNYAEMNKFSQHGSGRENTEETRVDLSTTLSCALSQIPDLASNPKLGFETISMYIDGWRKNISTTMNSQAKRSAKDHALTTSINEEMITMKSSLMNMQAMIQVNANQGNKNVDHISILNNKVKFVKKNVDKITLEISEKVNQFETWIKDMKASDNNMEIPQSITESIQEIITNSSPGLAVTEIRGEFETLRGEVMSGKHMTEMLRGLVTKLKLQMDSNSSQD